MKPFESLTKNLDIKEVMAEMLIEIKAILILDLIIGL